MLKYIILFQLITYIASDLSCQRCASEDPNSDCRNGTIKEKYACPPDEQACYTEDLINKGSSPYYRRGCAPEDWCQTQNQNHDTVLKFCSVCKDSDMCNNKRIGSEDPFRLQCYKCYSENLDSDCRKGTIDIGSTTTCSSGKKFCVESYISTSSRSIWTRDCVSDDYCRKLEKEYGHSLEHCEKCEDDFCNNNELFMTL